MLQEHGFCIRIAHQSCQCLHCSRRQNWLCASPGNCQQCINTACRLMTVVCLESTNLIDVASIARAGQYTMEVQSRLKQAAVNMSVTEELSI